MAAAGLLGPNLVIYKKWLTRRKYLFIPRPAPAVIGAAVKENNDDDTDSAAEVMQTTVLSFIKTFLFDCPDLFHLMLTKEKVASGMESTQATRPLQDASGSSTKQTSDNQESKPREQKKSVDRKISFNPGTADPDSALGGATEAGGS